MDFENIFNILTREDSREEFFIRLKQVGENSEEFQSLRKIMISLGMHRTPRHVHQTTLLQHTFQFSEPFECYSEFRLVCKSWKFAIETKPRFDHVDCCSIHSIMKTGSLKHSSIDCLPLSCRKTIQSLKNIHIRISEASLTIISKYAYNLQSLFLWGCHLRNFPTIDNYTSSVLQLLGNSIETIAKIRTPYFIFPEGIEFSNLTEIDFRLYDGENQLNVSEFESKLQNLLRSAPNLKVIKIDLHDEFSTEVLQHIGTKYGKHCIINRAWMDGVDHLCNFLNYVPVKIIHIFAFPIAKLGVMRFANQIEYLSFYITDKFNDVNYRTIFQSFPSLKGIGLFDGDEDVMIENDFYENNDLMKRLGENNLQIWRERLTYIKSIGIKILDGKTFLSMEEKISKTIPWRFHFHDDVRLFL